MNVMDLYRLIKQGGKPVIKFNEGVYEWMFEAADEQMMARIIEATIEDDDSVRFLIELNEFEAHNRSVASHDWRDKDGNCTLTWFDTIFYPKDGKETIYLPKNENVKIAFDLIDEKSLFSEYVNSQLKISYVEWLENEIIKLRTK